MLEKQMLYTIVKFSNLITKIILRYLFELHKLYFKLPKVQDKDVLPLPGLQDTSTQPAMSRHSKSYYTSVVSTVWVKILLPANPSTEFT